MGGLFLVLLISLSVQFSVLFKHFIPCSFHSFYAVYWGGGGGGGNLPLELFISLFQGVWSLYAVCIQQARKKN